MQRPTRVKDLSDLLFSVRDVEDVLGSSSDVFVEVTNKEDWGVAAYLASFDNELGSWLPVGDSSLHKPILAGHRVGISYKRRDADARLDLSFPEFSSRCPSIEYAAGEHSFSQRDNRLWLPTRRSFSHPDGGELRLCYVLEEYE